MPRMNRKDRVAIINPLEEIGGVNSGTTYFVDGNSGVDTNSGLSWEKAFKTLAVAFAASHADIARGSDRWARRNTVYIAGDDFVETLIILPQKTDVIGVGSSDNYPMPCIRGNHAPLNNAAGCRFYNVRFKPASAAVLMTLTSACGNTEFHGCLFDAAWSTFVAVSAILATACGELKVDGCKFIGAFSGAVVDLAAGNVSGVEITNNKILGGSTNGIQCTGTTTIVQQRFGLIAGNLIYVDDVTIDDGADGTFIVMNNTCVSIGALGGTSHVITAAFAAGNIVTGNGVGIMVPKAIDA